MIFWEYQHEKDFPLIRLACHNHSASSRNKSFDFPTATCQMSRSAGLGDLEVRIFGLFFSEVFYDLSLDKGSTLCRTATISFKRKTN